MGAWGKSNATRPVQSDTHHPLSSSSSSSGSSTSCSGASLMAEDSLVLNWLRRASVCSDDKNNNERVLASDSPLPNEESKQKKKCSVLSHLFLPVGAFVALLLSQLFVLLPPLQVLGHGLAWWLLIPWRPEIQNPRWIPSRILTF